MGFIFLIFIGWSSWRSGSETQPDQGPSAETSLKQKILFTLSVSLLNPHAIMDTVGVLGTSSLSYNGEAKTGFTLACILVSWTWFFALALSGRFLGAICPFQQLRKKLSRISAVIIWLCAIYLIVSFYRL